MTQTLQTNLDHKARLGPSVTSANGAAHPSKWLSELLTRASREDPSSEDQPTSDGLRLAPLASSSTSALSQERVASSETAHQDHHKATMLTNELRSEFSKVLENELSEPVEVKKEAGLQASWPDLPSALDLVKKAAQLLAGMEKRATVMEARALQIIKQAQNELAATMARAKSFEERAVKAEQIVRELKVELAACEERASHFEVNARLAEDEVKNAKAWMIHVHNVITNTLASAVDDLSNIDSRRGELIAELESKLEQGTAGKGSAR